MKLLAIIAITGIVILIECIAIQFLWNLVIAPAFVIKEITFWTAFTMKLLGMLLAAPTKASYSE